MIFKNLAFCLRKMQDFWALFDYRINNIMFSAWSEREVLDFYIDCYLLPSFGGNNKELCKEYNVKNVDELKNVKYNQEVRASMKNTRIVSGQIDTSRLNK